MKPRLLFAVLFSIGLFGCGGDDDNGCKPEGTFDINYTRSSLSGGDLCAQFYPASVTGWLQVSINGSNLEVVVDGGIKYAGTLVSCSAHLTATVNVPETAENYGINGSQNLDVEFTAVGLSGAMSISVDIIEGSVTIESCTAAYQGTGVRR